MIETSHDTYNFQTKKMRALIFFYMMAKLHFFYVFFFL